MCLTLFCKFYMAKLLKPVAQFILIYICFVLTKTYNTPFSKLSICSFVKDVLFRCSFRFSLNLNWESSSPEELCSEFPSEVFSCIASAETRKAWDIGGVQEMYSVLSISMYT